MVLPYYLSIGMSSDEFWNGPPKLASAFREAEKMRREAANAAQWIQGRYIYEAVGVVIHNSFRKEGTAPLRYPDKPYRIAPLTKEEEEEEDRKEIQRVIDNLNAMQRSLNGRNQSETRI